MSWHRQLVSGILQLVYPGACCGCGSSVPEVFDHFCESCLRTLFCGDRHYCRRCGESIGQHASIAEGCPACRNESLVFDAVIRIGAYDGLLRQLVLRMKHAANEGLAEVVAAQWVKSHEASFRELGDRTVVPVPLHWARRWQRGYNQSESIAHTVARRLGWEFQPGWVRRIRYTRHQTDLPLAERRSNVRDAFDCRRTTEIRCRKILLVDDVLTTGATCNEVSRVLKRAGAAAVDVAVLARSLTHTRASISPQPFF